LESAIPIKATASQRREGIEQTIRRFPALIEYYIKSKEDNGDKAVASSDIKVAETDELFVQQQRALTKLLETETAFYEITGGTYAEALQRLQFFKDVKENKGGHRVFNPNGYQQ